jgi:hypothetical protein
LDRLAGLVLLAVFATVVYPFLMAFAGVFAPPPEIQPPGVTVREEARRPLHQRDAKRGVEAGDRPDVFDNRACD